MFYGGMTNVPGAPRNLLAGGTSFEITPGGDARRARKGLSPQDVQRLMEANPDFGNQIQDMYLPGPKSTPFFKKAEVPGSSNLPAAIGNMGGIANAQFFEGPQLGQAPTPGSQLAYADMLSRQYFPTAGLVPGFQGKTVS